MIYRALITTTCLALILVACGGEQREVREVREVVVVVTATPQPPPADAPAPAAVPPATSTPPAAPAVAEAPAAPSPTPGCVFSASFVADVTIPDDTVFAPGATFVKTWRVLNDGTCTWPAGTQIVHVSGPLLSPSSAAPAPLAAPGATADLSVSMVAPSTPGTHRSVWQLQGPDGVRYGKTFWVQIIVPNVTAAAQPPANPPAPTDTPVPAAPPANPPAPTNTPVPGPNLPALGLTPISPGIKPTLMIKLPPGLFGSKWVVPVSLVNARVVYNLRLGGPGRIAAQAVWSGSQGQMSLIVNGPGMSAAYARQDGGSGTMVIYDVTSADFAAGNTWQVTVASYGSGEASGSAQMSYPAAGGEAVFTHNFSVAPQGARAIFPIKLSKAGTVRAKMTWDGAPGVVTLRLFGPSQPNYYALQSGSSPLEMSYTVTDADLSKGSEWRVTLATAGYTDLLGTMEITLP
ncbi:MAG: NBR1-Ig-like domain-containing protein [Thermoflexales bacterium]|nr:NBR1-Ig-like domain-containing protein [Thermoflexales bacterium]